MVISRICPGGPLGHLTDLPWGGPWSSHGFPIRDPRLPVAILGELERIPEEVSGWNGSELDSERIHVRFSRNRRWNSGGWHRPGKAESGGFWWCRGPPDFFSGRCAGQQIRPMRASIKLLHLGENFGGVPRPAVPYGTLPCPPGGRSALAPGRQGILWPLVIWRMCGGIPGFRSRSRASSRGFPRKFLDGMAQN